MLPAACSTASEVKFSLAISSSREFCRSVSRRICSKISGSVSERGNAMRSCSVIVRFSQVKFDLITHAIRTSPLSGFAGSQPGRTLLESARENYMLRGARLLIFGLTTVGLLNAQADWGFAHPNADMRISVNLQAVMKS